MANLTMLRVLGEQKLATLSEGVVKSALTNYYNDMISVESSTWEAYKSFALAYANMQSVKNSDGSDRFPTKGRFYDFVGVNDSTGSLMLRAVGFNAVFSLNEQSLEEMGFSACKVDMLSRVGAYKAAKDSTKEATYDAVLFTKFMSYVATRFTDSKGNVTIKFEDLATISDASLRALISDWDKAGKPDKYVVTKSAIKEQTQEQTQEQEQTEEYKEALEVNKAQDIIATCSKPEEALLGAIEVTLGKPHSGAKVDNVVKEFIKYVMTTYEFKRIEVK